MPKALTIRAMTDTEQELIQRLARKRTAPSQLVQRAQIIWKVRQGVHAPQVAQELGIKDVETVYRWIKRFNALGVAGLRDEARSGRPATYSEAEVSQVVALSLTDPQTLGLPFGSWSLDRLVAYLNDTQGIAIKRSRISELLVQEGLRWRKQERWFGERVDPDFAEKRGSSATSTRSHPPTASSSV